MKKNLSELSDWYKKEVLDQLGWDYSYNAIGELTYEIGDTIKLVDLVKKELNKELGSHNSDVISNVSGALKVDLSMSLNAEKIETYITSLMNKKLIKQKVNGDALVQLANTFFTESLGSEKYENPTEEQLKELGSDLPFYEYEKGDKRTKAMKVKVAFRGDFQKLAKAKDKDGKQIGVYNGKTLNVRATLAKLNELLKDDEWLDQGDNRRMVTMTGVGVFQYRV